MKIVIHPKARKVMIVIALLTVVAIVLLTIRSVIFPNPEVPATDLAPDEQAAVDAVTAFYTLDYSSSSELWISNVCAFSTNQGCNAIRSFFAPIIYNEVQNYQVQTGCRVIPIQLIENDGNTHIWQISVTLNHPWVGLDTPTQDVYVEVTKVRSVWLMNRILFEQEIKRIITPTQKSGDIP
jgi:hypothetical protein